jgi:pimeloyl-ACP methyl ester carboxylesterase
MASLTFSISITSLLIAPLLTGTFAFPTVHSRGYRSPPTNSTSSSIEWKTCPEELEFPESLYCGTLTVPINWDAPYGEHFDLGLVKLPATPSNTTSKVGSLFVNPGGPGGSATSFVATIAGGAFQSDALFASFDLIGVDPRGVDLSHQVECDVSIYAERVSVFPTSAEEYDALVDKNRRLGESCRERTGPLLEHLDTISAAKDHEAVRIALGDEPMNFLGLSYGSQLGAQYAALFPNNIRTLALDGIVQHAPGEAANLFVETSSYQQYLMHLFDWAATNESSVLQGQDVQALWTMILASATETPIPALSCNGTNCRTDVNAEEILFNTQSYTAVDSWGRLAEALHNASRGDASALSTSFTDASALSLLGIGCLDWTRSDSLSSIQAKLAMADSSSPLVRGASQTWTSQHACIGWPVPVKNPPKKLDIKTEATVLMAASTGDPSTGLPWAVGMLEEIEKVVLVVREGDGHTSLPLGGETAEIIVGYLVSGVAPDETYLTTRS